MILDGKKVRNELLSFYEEKIKNESMKISLAIIYVGNDEPSKVYIKNKIKYCEKVGIKVILYEMDAKTKEKEVIELIEKLNDSKDITGIILQSPVPRQISFSKCSGLIKPCKDIDGFTKENLYKLVHNDSGLFPCTSKGIIMLLKYYDITLAGKNVCIVGRGDIVGKPLIFEMLNNNATVIVCHSHTKNISEFTEKADIVISAVGKPHLIKSNMVKDDAIVIDVGISIVDGKIIGDVDFDNLKDKCTYITPNPGGIGPMTIAMIIDNLIKAYYMQKESVNG